MRISKLLAGAVARARNNDAPPPAKTPMPVFAATVVGDTAFSAGLGYECATEGMEGAIWTGMLAFSTGITVGGVAADYFGLEGHSHSAAVWGAGSVCAALGAACGAYGRAWEAAALTGSGALLSALYWDYPEQ